MKRQFEVCHSCRRCFNLCDSFPTLFDLIDDSPNESVDDLTKKDFEDITDKCTLCDMCFMTKCPYVPPHEFNIDFPHLMLRYRTFQDKQNKLPKIPKELAKIDRNANLANISPTLANWSSDKKNSLTRRPLEMISRSEEMPTLLCADRVLSKIGVDIEIFLAADCPGHHHCCCSGTP